jgi:hypothetical protein
MIPEIFSRKFLVFSFLLPPAQKQQWLLVRGNMRTPSYKDIRGFNELSLV